ncbi:MAG: RluA family pseudouridine synthase [Eubacterium sp.]|nr:RluA family pseudouridine synthase [Eubacterium sp.]
MKSFTITQNDSGQRVDKFILKTFPKLPKSLMYKEIRKKNIKVNKKRTEPNAVLNEGDVIELYLKDDVLEEKPKHYDFTGASRRLDIVYEDDNIILLNKKTGLLCHPDGNEYVDTLISRVKRYLYEKGEWTPEESSTFTPSLANRIDRNTSGIVIAAKNAESLRILNEKIKSREIEKYYITAVHGKPKRESDTLTAYLSKDEKKNMVTVSDTEFEGSKKIITRYKVLESRNNISLLEIDLKTGRTHQIRAHLAHLGHPIVDDGKYGDRHGRSRQALCSYKLVFNIKNAGILDYLSGREFEISDCEIINNFQEDRYK